MILPRGNPATLTAAMYLSEYCARRGLSIKDVIKLTAKPRSYVYAVMNGTRYLTIPMILRFEKTLGVSGDQLALLTLAERRR